MVVVLNLMDRPDIYRLAKPMQAALASAASFAVGAALPLVVTAFGPEAMLIPLVSGTSLLFLALLGGVAAKAGGAGVWAGTARVTFWGALAMALTASIGKILLLIEISARLTAQDFSGYGILDKSIRDSVGDSGIWQHLHAPGYPLH